jgi:hypothetical protein
MGSLTKALIGKEDCDVSSNGTVYDTFSRLNSTGSTITLTSFPDIWKSNTDIINAKYYGAHDATGATLNSAVGQTVNNNCKGVYLEGGEWVISTDYDWSSYTTVRWVFGAGAYLSIAAGCTVTFPSPANIVASPNQQIFSGAGTVAFSAGGSGWVDWWGTNTTPGTTDMASAINAAITALGEVNFNANTYRANSKINLKSNLILNLSNTQIQSYVTSGYAMGGAAPTTVAYSNLIIKSSLYSKIQMMASGATGCLDLRSFSKSSIYDIHLVGYYTTTLAAYKGSREGIGLNYQNGTVAATYPCYWNMIYNPTIDGFATGVSVTDLANGNGLFNPRILHCDDYGVYIGTDGGDSFLINGGDIGINGDNATGANIYTDDVRTLILGTRIEDASGSGYGIVFDTNAAGYFELARIYGSGGTAIVRTCETGISSNGTTTFALTTNRLKLSPVTDAEVPTPVEGDLIAADGTNRYKGIWTYDADNTKYLPLRSAEQTLTFAGAGADVTVDLDLGNVCRVTVTDTTAFTIANPTNNHAADDVYFIITNSSGGVMLGVSWGTNYAVANITEPDNTKHTVVHFVRHGSKLWYLGEVANLVA